METNETLNDCNNPELTPRIVDPYDVYPKSENACTRADWLMDVDPIVLPPYHPAGGSDGGSPPPPPPPPPPPGPKPWMSGLLHLLSSGGVNDFWSNFDSQTEESITLDFVDGFRGRSAWDVIQPSSADVYNWAGIDSVVTKAKNAGKRLTLSIYAGTSVPDWAYDTAPTFDRFPIDTDGDTINDSVIPIPWNTNYLNKWFAFIDAFGAKYDDEDTVANIFFTGYGQQHVEFHVVEDDQNIIDFNQRAIDDGFADKSAGLRFAVAAVMDRFRAAFPRTAVMFTGGNPWGGGPEGLADQNFATDYSTSTPYGGHCTSALHAVTQHTNIPMTLPYPKGFQPIFSSNDQARFYSDPIPDPYPDPPVPIYDLTQNAVEKGAQYLEIYDYDLVGAGNTGGVNNPTFIAQRLKLIANLPT